MCDMRYFKMARHHLVSAKEMAKNYTWDELFINDAAYKLQQCVEFTLKAFLECKGLTVPETHLITKLIEMSDNNGSACIITEWIREHSYMLSEWESQTRYNFDYCIELQKLEEALKEIEIFIIGNGMTDEKDEHLTDEVITCMKTIIPKTKFPSDNFELNVYYRVFYKKIKQKLKI